MASFYGNVSYAGGDGSVSDYNQLSNIPIKNLTGTTAVPILLAALEPGSYNINGTFKCGENTSLEEAVNLFVTILGNGEQKTVRYDGYEDDSYFIITAKVLENNEVSLNRLSIGENGQASNVAEEVKLFTF